MFWLCLQVTRGLGNDTRGRGRHTVSKGNKRRVKIGMVGAGNKKHTKGKLSTDPGVRKEQEHISKVFGTTTNKKYTHTGYARTELPYIARDAASRLSVSALPRNRSRCHPRCHPRLIDLLI